MKHSFAALVFVCALLCVGFVLPQKASAFTVSKPNAANNLGLVGWWTMDGVDTMTGLVRDKSGQGNHGSQTSMATSTAYGTGKIGQALRFDGLDDRIILSSAPISNFSNPNTVCAWALAPQGTSGRIINIASGTDGMNVGINVSKMIVAYAASSVEYGGQSAASVPVGQWNHYCAVWNGSLVSLYLNATNLATSTTASFGGQAGNTIGQRGTFGSSNWQGMIDDVRIYNRALSASEILALYKQGDGTKQNTISRNAVTTGLLAHYTFDGVDTKTGLIRDISGNGYHGSSVNIASSTFYAAGKIGQAGNFDGTDDRVDISTDFVGTTAITFTAWVYPRALSTGIIFFHNGKFFIQGLDTGRFRVTSDGVTLLPSASNSLKIDTWNFMTVTRDTSGSAVLYVNGNSVASGSTGTPAAASATTRIGSNGSAFMNGLIDDVRIYNRVLSSSEIQQLYNLASSTMSTTVRNNANTSNGLVGHWTFDGKDMRTGLARDISGNGNHGSLVNMATSSAYVLGRMGQALQFDGVDDVVRMSSDFVGTNPLTISLWMYARSFGGSNAGRLVTNLNTTGFYLHVTSSSNRLKFTSDSGTHTIFSATNAVILNQWEHIALTRDASGVANFYVNGVLNGSANQDSGTPAAGSTNLAIGAHHNAVTVFDGYLDDVRIYNRVLSAAEIRTLYNQGR